MKKLTIYMSAALLLSSCGLYNKYERPDVDVTGIVRDPVSLTDTLAVTDTTSFGNMPWRSVFTDPQLQTLIETGLQNNPDLLNAALNVQMVNEALKIAKLAFLPSLALSPQGTLPRSTVLPPRSHTPCLSVLVGMSISSATCSA